MTAVPINSMSEDLQREAAFRRLVLQNPINRAILERLPHVGLRDAWLVSGCLFQTAWNIQTGRAPTQGIRDYDLFYFDQDVSWEAEDRFIRRSNEVFGDLDVSIEVRNQARVHLWYKDRFGIAGYPPLISAVDGLRFFLAPACMVAIRSYEEGLRVFAPASLADVFNMIVRPNTAINNLGRADRYIEKAERWKKLWPELRVMPWPDQA